MPDRHASAAAALGALHRRLLAAKTISLGKLLDELGTHGLGVAMLVLGGATLVPGSAPVFGAALCLVGIALALGRDAIWLPDWLRRRTVRTARAAATIDRMLPLVTWLERFARRRWPRWLQGGMRRLVGAAVVADGLLIVLPIPLGNIAPAAAVLMLTLGLIAGDGVAVIAGHVATVVGLAVAIVVGVLGYDAVGWVLRST